MLSRVGGFHYDLWPGNMLLDAGRNDDEHGGKSLFSTMATSVLGLNTSEVTAATEILGPGSSIYTILAVTPSSLT